MKTLPLIISVILLISQNCLANDLSDYLGLEVSESYQIATNYLDRIEDDFSRDESVNLLRVTPHLSWAPEKWMRMDISADLIWQNPVTNEDDDEIAVDLTAAYLNFRNQTTNLTLGGQTIQFGRGLILTDETLAAALNWRLGKTYIDLKAARILDASPMVGATIGYQPGLFERVELFGVWFRDQEDIFANSLPLLYQIRYDPSSEGTVYWLGALADLFVGPALISMVGAYQTGNFSVTSINLWGQRITREIDLSAYFFDLSMEGNFASWGSLGAFCYVASGDQDPLQGELNAYASLMAFNPRMAIFFNPDFFDRDDSETFIFGGATYGGVIAPGVSLTLTPVEAITFDASAATIYAQEALPDGEQWYGFEIDLSMTYTFLKHYEIYCQAARFMHGDYFESTLERNLKPASSLSIGGRLLF